VDGPGDAEHPGIALHDLELLLRKAVPHLMRGPFHPFESGHTMTPYEGMDEMKSGPFFITEKREAQPKSRLRKVGSGESL
jgi:hypothetical protein